jgi:crotonobetainyl-CoA:carnitine CoA-transferase CaiB-like acyl-CoA transferase
MSETKGNPGPLSGVKIVDMTRALAGPICTMILADMGAEAIKIEDPVKAGASRPGQPSPADMPRMFERNKKSITLNLRSAKGKEILRRLIQWGDVVVENYRPGVMDSMGFPYPVMQKINPRIIMTSISGFGQSGPYANRAAFDTVGEAMGGIMAVTGPADSPPMASGAAIADIGSGVFGALGTALALYHQKATGLGQHVDASLMESIVFFMGMNLNMYNSGQPAGKGAVFSPQRTPACGTFLTSDGFYIVIMALTDPHWSILTKIIGREELAKAPGYATRVDRGKRGEEIEAMIQAWVKLHTIDEVEAIVDKAGIPYGRVLTLLDLIKDPHLRARGRVVDVDHKGKKIPIFAPYPILSATPGSLRMSWPQITGQHNEEVYCGILGMSKEELVTLKSEGVI